MSTQTYQIHAHIFIEKTVDIIDRLRKDLFDVTTRQRQLYTNHQSKMIENGKNIDLATKEFENLQQKLATLEEEYVTEMSSAYAQFKSIVEKPLDTQQEKNIQNMKSDLDQISNNLTQLQESLQKKVTKKEDLKSLIIKQQQIVIQEYKEHDDIKEKYLRVENNLKVEIIEIQRQIDTNEETISKLKPLLKFPEMSLKKLIDSGANLTFVK